MRSLEGFEIEKEKAELNTAQMLEKIVKLYLELVESPKVEQLAKKTFRIHELMIRQLVKKGIQFCED
jgi:N-dimethylarginine dimethylaminohydrolase